MFCNWDEQVRLMMLLSQTVSGRCGLESKYLVYTESTGSFQFLNPVELLTKVRATGSGPKSFVRQRKCLGNTHAIMACEIDIIMV